MNEVYFLYGSDVLPPNKMRGQYLLSKEEPK